ncbi:MAG: hypothetical protein IJS69_01640 [Selenomonadaceae bacterium]|nr:hypothetical protein [Selenomonadaceae bacterium]
MPSEVTTLKLITEDDGSVRIKGDETELKKTLIVIGESILNEDGMTQKNLNTLVDIGEYLWSIGKPQPEYMSAAKKFFEAAEKYSDPRATDYLSTLQKNPLVSEAMWLRAADRDGGSAIDNLREDYKAQASWWRKKIAEAEGKTFDGEAPTDEEMLSSDRLRFFAVYKRALDGDVDAMKLCLDFCEEEFNYWKNR